MPVKKTKKPRARKAPAKKKGLKQKQKQKQEQKVNVSVSAGGSGGGTQFIPMPSAPAFDYAQLAQLIRPAATVDVPIRAQANPEPIAAREASSQTLAQEFPRPQRAAPPIPVKEKSKSKSKSKSKQPLYASMSEREAGYETFPSSESERETREIVRKQEAQAASMFRKYGKSAFEEE